MGDSILPKEVPPIAAIVAAAGRSMRMGEPKQLLPWEGRTVLASVALHLDQAGAEPVICVVGHRAAEMKVALADAPSVVLDNPEYLEGEMLSSYQAGARYLQGQATPFLGTLLALGDQPHVPVEVIRQVLDQARISPQRIVVPSFDMRRGHPFYLPSAIWDELVALSHEETLRTLMQRHQAAITYVNVATDAILRDIDTPSDYQALSGSNINA